MNDRLSKARLLDQEAANERTLARAQALAEEADRLRNLRKPSWSAGFRLPLIRN